MPPVRRPLSSAWQGTTSTGLDAAPPGRSQQFPVPGLERFEQFRGNSQEWQPLFGKDVVLAHEEPWFSAHFFFVVRRHRELAKVALAQRGHLVIVVEDHLALAGDPEILEQ